MYLNFAPTIFRTLHSLQVSSLQVNPGPFHGSLDRAGYISSTACRPGRAVSLRVKFYPSVGMEAVAVH